MLAGLTRLELATFRVTGERSNQLSYSPNFDWVVVRLRLSFDVTTLK